MSYLLIWGGSLSASALPDDNFDPQNPEEPSAVDICRIKVSANPAEGAYVSGGGRYIVKDEPVYISTNACNTEDYTYTFKYWTQNGEVTSYSQDFWFYPTKGDFEFVAHYEKAEVVFDPNNPAEPSSSNIKRKYYLYLTSNLEGACSFNMNSGDKIEEDRQFYVYPYYNSSYYKFEGWKVNGQIISTDSYLYYTMPSANTTLEACFSEIPYDPENPVEPSSQGGNVDNSTRRIMDVSIGNSSGYVDKTRIVLNEKRSIDYESDCDASKFTSNTAGFQIYSIGGDVKYSINERPLDNGEIPLGIIVKNAGSVTIGATRLECSATLVDKVLNKEQDLVLGNYTFDSEAGTFDDRFYIRIAVTDALTITAKSCTRAYGEANPTFEYTSTGAVLKGYPSITCEATPTSDVGTYDIVVSKGSVSNTYVTYVNGILTITAKTVDSPTITLSETCFTYDGNAKEPTVTVKDGETTIPASEYSVSYSNNTNAGTATVTITDVEGGNYTVSGTATFTITKADGSITAPTAKSGLVYSGSAQNLIDAGSSTTGTVKYSLDDTTYDTAIPQGTDAGKYTVYYKVEGDANHGDVAAQSLDVTIAAKTVASPTITLGTTSYTYDGTAKEPTVTVKDGETIITATEYSVSYTNNTNVGTATVTITDVEGGNYTVSGSATFAISSADGSLTPPVGKSDLVYNGSAQDLITAGTTTTGTIKYSLDDTTYDTAIPQGTNAAKYTVYYKVEGDANHSDIAAQSFDVTIAKASLAVSVGEYTITEGDDIPTFAITYDGFKNNETVEVLTTAPTVTCNATKDSKAGEYEIGISGGAATNYEFSYTAGKLIIKQKEFEETVEGGDNSEEGVEVTFAITNDNNDGSGGEETPTVAVSKGSDVSGECIIPDKVTHGDKTYEVTEIAAGAFENNEKLESVTIPESVETIGDNAFSGCTGLQSIKMLRETPIDFSSPATARGMRTRASASSIFDGVDLETCILYVPEVSVDKYKAAEVWKEFKNILPIASSGIRTVLNADGRPFSVYNLNGRKVKANATSLDGLPKGVYIINNRKIVVD